MNSARQPQLSDVGFIFYVNGEARTPEEYEQAYLVPAVGKRRTKSCVQMIQVQLLFVCRGNPAAGTDITSDGSRKTYVVLSDYNLRVFYDVSNNTIQVYEAVP